MGNKPEQCQIKNLIFFYFALNNKGKHAYQTHWLECLAIARKLFWGCSLSRQWTDPLEHWIARKYDNHISTGPLYFRNMFVLIYE